MAGKTARLAGVITHDAASFISSANAAFRAYFLQQFAASEDDLISLSGVIDRLGQPRRYPAACLLAPLLRTRDKTRRCPA